MPRVATTWSKMKTVEYLLGRKQKNKKEYGNSLKGQSLDE